VQQVERVGVVVDEVHPVGGIEHQAEERPHSRRGVEIVEQRRAAGLSAPEEDRPTYVVGLNVPNRIEIIADQLLKRGYSAAVTEKVVGANFVRVFTQIWAP